MEARSSLLEQIWVQQFDDPQLRVIHDRVLNVESRNATLYPKGILIIEGHICVPRVKDLVKLIIKKAH